MEAGLQKAMRRVKIMSSTYDLDSVVIALFPQRRDRWLKGRQMFIGGGIFTLDEAILVNYAPVLDEVFEESVRELNKYTQRLF